MTSCAAPAGGAGLDGVDVARQAIVQGVVTRHGVPAGTAYVRLLDRHGEFVAEVPVSAAGQFRFFAATGEWTVRVLAPRAAIVDRAVSAQVGAIVDLEIDVAEVPALV